MTNEEKQQIEDYREKGLGYTKIARAMGLSENTVKSYCRRHNKSVDKQEQHKCLCCGKTVTQVLHRKEKKFCSDDCRMKWWKEHSDQINRKAIYDYICPTCGQSFKAYGNSHRKYCSHSCYIKDRFGGGSYDKK